MWELCEIHWIQVKLHWELLTNDKNHLITAWSYESVVDCRASLGSSLLCCMVWRCDTDWWLQLALCWQSCVCWLESGLVTATVSCFCLHVHWCTTAVMFYFNWMTVFLTLIGMLIHEWCDVYTEMQLLYVLWCNNQLPVQQMFKEVPLSVCFW